MNRYALILNGTVDNIAEAEAEWPFPEQQAILIGEGYEVKIGDSGDPSKWPLLSPAVPVAPPESLPSVAVSRFQARAALYQAGYLEAIDTYMALPDTPMLQKLAWADAQEFRRDSPTVKALASMLGMTQTQLDDLFIFASKIKA